jgi:hypothetical protein
MSTSLNKRYPCVERNLHGSTQNTHLRISIFQMYTSTLCSNVDRSTPDLPSLTFAIHNLQGLRHSNTTELRVLLQAISFLTNLMNQSRCDKQIPPYTESEASLSCRLPLDGDSSKLGFRCRVFCLVLEMNPYFRWYNQASRHIIKGGDLRLLTRLPSPVCQKISELWRRNFRLWLHRTASVKTDRTHVFFYASGHNDLSVWATSLGGRIYCFPNFSGPWWHNSGYGHARG